VLTGGVRVHGNSSLGNDQERYTPWG
jgi:hypothetical protein